MNSIMNSIFSVNFFFVLLEPMAFFPVTSKSSLKLASTSVWRVCDVLKGFAGNQSNIRDPVLATDQWLALIWFG